MRLNNMCVLSFYMAMKLLAPLNSFIYVYKWDATCIFCQKGWSVWVRPFHSISQSRMDHIACY